MVGHSSGCLCCRWAVNIPVCPSRPPTPRPQLGHRAAQRPSVRLSSKPQSGRRPGGRPGWDRQTQQDVSDQSHFLGGGEGAREGLAAMATGLGAQARTGHRQRGSREWGGWEAKESRSVR